MGQQEGTIYLMTIEETDQKVQTVHTYHVSWCPHVRSVAWGDLYVRLHLFSRVDSCSIRNPHAASMSTLLHHAGPPVMPTHIVQSEA